MYIRQPRPESQRDKSTRAILSSMYIINKLTHKTKQEHACCKAIVFKENQSTKHRTLFTELALNEAKCEEKKGKEKNASP